MIDQGECPVCSFVDIGKGGHCAANAVALASFAELEPAKSWQKQHNPASAVMFRNEVASLVVVRIANEN